MEKSLLQAQGDGELDGFVSWTSANMTMCVCVKQNSMTLAGKWNIFLKHFHPLLACSGYLYSDISTLFSEAGLLEYWIVQCPIL